MPSFKNQGQFAENAYNFDKSISRKYKSDLGGDLKMMSDKPVVQNQ